MSRFVLVVAATLCASSASAQGRAYVAQHRGDLDGDGKRDQVKITNGGAVEISVGSSRSSSRLGAGPVKAGNIEVTSGRFGFRSLVIVRVFESKQRRARGHAAVYTFKGPGKGFSRLWHGPVGGQGTDREWSREIAVSGRGLELYETRPELTHCHLGQPIRLYGKVFDFRGQKRFRPYRVKRSGFQKAQPLTMSDGKPQGWTLPSRPIFVRATAATSRWGATGADGLVVPSEVDDGDPRTAWIEGRGGSGVGEQVVFQQSKPADKIAAIAIVPGHGASADEFKKRGRVRSFGLFLHAGDGNSTSYRVSIPRDPARAASPHQRVWWAKLNKPVAAHCAALTLLDSYRGSAAAGKRDDVAIAEIHLFTEAELTGNVDRELSKRVAAGGDRGRVAARALANRGNEGAEALVSILKATVDGDARQRIYAALLRQRSVLVAPALADAVVDPSTPKEARDLFLTRLAGLGDEGAHALALIIRNPKAAESARLDAVAKLRTTGSPRALTLFTTVAGHGSREIRRAVALAIGGRFSGEIETLIMRAQNAANERAEADLWRAVGIAARSSTGFAQAAPVKALASRLAQVEDYERRYRIVQALAGLHAGAAALQAWWQEAAQKQDAKGVALRRVVVHGARRNQQASWLRRAAMSDADPGVRAAGARSLSEKELLAANTGLPELLEGDSWPLVRIAAAESLAKRCAREHRIRALESAARRDAVVDVQQAAILALIKCSPAQGRKVALSIANNSKQKVGARAFSVRQLGAAGDKTAVQPLISLLDKSRGRAFDSKAEQQVAVATITALGRLRDRRAQTPLLKASQDEAYPQIQAAAAAALASFCSSLTTKRLRTLSASPQRTVAIAAKRSLRTCRR